MMRCSYCGKRGHNIRTCPDRIARFGKEEVSRRNAIRCSFCGQANHTYRKCKLYEEAQVWYDETTVKNRRDAQGFFEKIGVGFGSLIYVLLRNYWRSTEESPKFPILASLDAATSALKNVVDTENLSEYVSEASVGKLVDGEFSIGLPFLVHLERDESGKVFSLTVDTFVPNQNEVSLRRNLLSSLRSSAGEGSYSVEDLISLLSPHVDKNDNVLLAKVFGNYADYGWAVVLPVAGGRLHLSSSKEKDAQLKKDLFRKRDNTHRPFTIQGYSAFRNWKYAKEAEMNNA